MRSYVCWFEDTPEFKIDVRAQNHTQAAEMFCHNWNERDVHDETPDPYLISVVVQDITSWTEPQMVVVEGMLNWQYTVYSGDEEEERLTDEQAEELQQIVQAQAK